MLLKATTHSGPVIKAKKRKTGNEESSRVNQMSSAVTDLKPHSKQSKIITKYPCKIYRGREKWFGYVRNIRNKHLYACTFKNSMITLSQNWRGQILILS